MSAPPPLIPFRGEWETYLDEIYQAFLDSFVRQDIRFGGTRVTAPRRPETDGKGAGFWHVISEAPDKNNRNEEDRIPDLRRCERITWITWAIEGASNGNPHLAWWKNKRRDGWCVVIWSEEYNFAVILGERADHYILKTAYCELPSGRRRTFAKERDAYWTGQK